MKVFTSSDLHLNMYFQKKDIPYYIEMVAKAIGKNLLEKEADYYIINGDISWSLYHIDLFLDTLTKELDGNCELRYVLGNHELSRNFTIKEFLEHDYKGISLSKHPIHLEDKIIYGLDGFSDLTYVTENYGKHDLESCLQEYNKRYFSDEKEITMEDINYVVDEQIKKLEQSIEKTDKAKILITHYVPREEFVVKAYKYDTEWKNLYMGSKKYKDMVIRNGFSECYFGHTHRRLSLTMDMKLDGTQFYCMPIGTYKHWTEYGYIDVHNEQTFKLYMKQWEETLLEI